jgi:hypothetical protein
MNSIEKIKQLIQQAESQRLFGEIVLRFRNGRLTFVVTTQTTPMLEELERDHAHVGSC